MDKLRKNYFFCQALLFVCLIFFFSSCGFVGYRASDSSGAPVVVYHRVEVGENLSRIAVKYGVEVKTVALLNGIRNLNNLKVGDLILISYGRGPYQGGQSSSQVAESLHPESVESLKGGRLKWPVAGGRISSKFGMRRRGFHDGIDIAAKSGTAIYASHNGIVAYSGSRLRGYGNLVILKDRQGTTTVYAHNRRNFVREGQKVTRGTKIAEVGSTGKSTGPHLHFELRMKDKKGRYIAVDPMPFFGKSSGKPARYRVNESLTPILSRFKFW